MRDLSVVAENLRLVQRARRDFLDFHTVEHGVIRPMLEGMVDDLCHAIVADLADDYGHAHHDSTDPAG